jgi:uncharacterized protein (UPF0548 family)
MFLPTRPSDQTIQRFIAAQTQKPFSYTEVSATKTGGAPTYTIDHNRIKLGTGPEVFARAVEAIKAWKQFDLGWVSLVPRGMRLEPGVVVAVLAQNFGFWSLNACRVVYLIDEERKFGFAYGTLKGHVEKGEERFTIEWQADDSVWYDILAFSKPNKLIVKLTKPLARRLQKRFARDSLAKMRSEIRDLRSQI